MSAIVGLLTRSPPPSLSIFYVLSLSFSPHFFTRPYKPHRCTTISLSIHTHIVVSGMARTHYFNAQAKLVYLFADYHL